MKGFVNTFRIEDAIAALVKLMDVKKHNALAIELLLLDIPYIDWNETQKPLGFHIEYFDKTDFTFPVAADTTARDLLGLAVIYKQLNGDMQWKDVCKGINCFDVTLVQILRITNESLSILYPSWSIDLYNSLGDRLHLKRMTWLDISDTHFVYRRERAPVQELVEENISLTSDSLLGRQYHAPVVSTTQTTAAAVTEDPISEFFNQDNLSVNAFQIDKRMVTCVVYNVVYFYIRHPMTVEGEIISHGTGQFIRIPCSSRKQALKRAAIIHCAQECMPGRPSESKTMQILNCILYAQGKTYDKEMTKAVFDLVDERIASGKKLRGFHDDYFTELCKDESQMKKIRV